MLLREKDHFALGEKGGGEWQGLWPCSFQQEILVEMEMEIIFRTKRK